jgi:hypothetical protein
LVSKFRIASGAVALAAGMALTPGIAQAAGTPQADKPMVPSTFAGIHANTHASPAFRTFSSPAAKSVRVVKTAALSGAATPQTPSPGLAVALSASDSSAYGISLDTIVSNTTVPVTITIAWGDGTSTPTSASGNVTVTTPHAYSKVGTYQVTVTTTDNQGDTVTNSVLVQTAGSAYTPYGPTRLLDTRSGLGAPKAKVAANGTVKLKIAGNGSIPAGVTAAVLNLTVTDATSAGFVTAYADGGAKPSTSNVNFRAGQTVPNLAIVPVGADGYVDLTTHASGTIDLVADIAGYFSATPSDGYTAVTPYRLLDTRYGTGAAKAKIPAHGSVAVRVFGSNGQMPSSGVAAVAFNMTITNPQASGPAAVAPNGLATAPVVSNVNFTTGQTIANAAVSPVGSDGYVRVYNNSGAPTDVILDVDGYYSASGRGAYVPVDPQRILDTRSWGGGSLPGYAYLPMLLAVDQNDKVIPGISAFVMNATVTNTQNNGFLAVAPDPNTADQYNNGTNNLLNAPSVSTLNWTKGATVPNLVQASTGANGIVDFFNQSGGNTDLILDWMGLYMTD